ncbi:SpoIIE family protein phosphatase [Streptomyces sp. NBC_00199]|uniref:SpoIIE family protein phosphatase n=1 Tax=Streptomyces sp. NBC_00199 TaxID=2975678 RepID=UPI0022553E6B|nr:SpoIIE family protein phosphatase [Streptomyces sp. NBC_00199]MCX5269396.1 SpoIIE family protein phosphatase [Streptomyces sp. NBC_00199]
MTLGLFRAIAKPLPHPVLLCGADGRVLAANPAAGHCDDRLRPGTSLYDLRPDDTPRLRQQLTVWLRSGSPVPGALVLKDADGRMRRFRCHGARATWWNGPQPAAQLHLVEAGASDRFVVLSQQVEALNREVAFRRATEADRARLLAAEQAARAQLQHLYDLTAALARAITLAQVARVVSEVSPPALGATAAELYLHSARLVPPLQPEDNALPAGAGGWTDLDQPSSSHGSPPCEAADAVPLALSLEADGVHLGMLIVYGSHSSTTPEHVTAVAQQIAQALRRAGLHEHEHRVAERLQRSLLPQLPQVPGLETATCYAPGSDLLSVGGDWYDVYDVDADHIGLSIGDVAGHGLPEATVMAQITAALRNIVPRCGTDPAAVLDELNTFLGRYHPTRMVTACYLVFDRRTRTLTYARAGHPPPLLIHADGTSAYLDHAISPPLGPIRNVRYRQADLAVAENDTLLLYTDGLIERRREDLAVGMQRLTACARTTTGLDTAELCDRFLHHQPEAAFPDDRALLAARFPTPA